MPLVVPQPSGFGSVLALVARLQVPGLMSVR
jgi:hypothetical protein